METNTSGSFTRRRRLLGLSLVVLVSLIVQQQSSAGAAESIPPLKTAAINGVGNAIEAHADAAVDKNNFSADARRLGEQIGILPDLEDIEKLSGSRASPTWDQSRFQLLAAKQDALETLMMTNYEVRFVTNRIDRELAKTNEILAYEAERRDRAIRINTYANFLSGGVTGMVRGGLKLGDVNHIPPEVIETAEGGIQASLASWAFHEQRGDRRLEEGVPNMLAKILQTSDHRPPEFPASVWNYLNTATSMRKDNATRRTVLINRWIEKKMCLIHRGHGGTSEVRAARLAGTAGRSRTVDIGVLEDRVAMLTDLRCSVTGMENLLLELIESLRAFSIR